MWLALVGAALGGSRMVSVTDRIALDAPIALAWTKLATADGVTTLEGAEPLEGGKGIVLDQPSERILASVGGETGTYVVLAIDGPRRIRIRWDPDDERQWRVIDLSLRERGEGTDLEATVQFPMESGLQRKRVSADLERGLEAFRAAVDGE